MKLITKSIILGLLVIGFSLGKAYAAEKKFLFNYVNFDTLLLALFLLCLIIIFLFYLYMNQKMDNLQIKLKETENALAISERFNTSLRESNNNLSEQIMWHEKNFKDVTKLYPDINKQISLLHKNELKTFDMETAENVDMVISTLIDLEPSPEILFQLLDANEKYCNLSRSQKRCIKSDINKFSNLLKESQRLYDLFMKKDRAFSKMNS